MPSKKKAAKDATPPTPVPAPAEPAPAAPSRARKAKDATAQEAAAASVPAAGKQKAAKPAKAEAPAAPAKGPAKGRGKAATGKAAPAKPKPGKAAPRPDPDDLDELEGLDDEAMAADLAGLDEELDEDDAAPAPPAAPAKGAPKAPAAAPPAGKGRATPPAAPGAGDDEDAPGIAGLLRALAAGRGATAPKRPAGGMDLGDDDEGAAPPPPPKPQRKVPPMPPRKPGVITLAISPDADDAFMLFALENGLVATEDRKYEIVRGEVSRLNEEAQRGTYDVTAFSFGSWPQLVDRYLVLPSGASLGDGVGPVVVSKTPVRSSEVNGLVVGVPGLSTTGALVLRMWLHPARLNLVALPFEAVPLAVAAGKVRAGVLIHEAQLTYRAQGLVMVEDLGRWWTSRTDGLPLPLGGMVVRRDIPQEERAKINLDLKRSIAYAMGHRAEALAHAAKYCKGLTSTQLERYIDNYVNELTLDIGERGRQAVQALFEKAKSLGFVRDVVELEMA